jgi:hypothetical protein
MMPDLKVTQLIAPQWTQHNGDMTYTLYGVDEKGRVYRYSGKEKKWLPYSMRIGKSERR